MKYVKLTARPDTWYKEGSEVYHEDFCLDYCYPGKRMTLAFWEDYLKMGKSHHEDGMWGRGIRVCDDNPNENNMGCKPGEEREDGEWCMIDEFNIEVVDSEN